MSTTDRSPERRALILQAAAKLFEHYGHSKTTIADVAREAQVGVGSVYLEFDSKEEIVAELSGGAHVAVLQSMRKADKKSEDAGKRLTAVLLARTQCFLEVRKKGQHACEMVHCKTDGVRAAHQKFRKDERVLLEEILEAGCDAGTFGPLGSAQSAALIQRMFASLSPPWVFMDGGLDEDALVDVARDLCALLLKGLLIRKESKKAR